jgi:RNA polymerase sigma factor (sigma-70 family)
MTGMLMPFDKHADPTDEALLSQYAAGDGSAAAVLTRRLLPRVYRHALRMLGDAAEAEDAAQETMMRLWRVAPDWRSGEAQITTWLFRVTANLCKDRLRKRRALGLDEIAEPPDPAPGVARTMQDRQRRDALQQALQALPDRQRQAVILRHIEGLSNPEIADIMDITPGAVESLTARGKRALADILAGRKSELGYQDD